MNRALGKPKEQAFESTVNVDWDKRIARLRAARPRLALSAEAKSRQRHS
jgi:hypothetical protein